MNFLNQKFIAKNSFFLIFILSLWLFISPSAQAQVSVSLGIQEIYDDNIYLEDDRGAFSAEAEQFIASLPLEQRTLFGRSERDDGDPDSDIISNLNLGLQTNFKFLDTFDLNIDANVGAAIFADNSDENRYLLDTLTNLRFQDGILPENLDINVSSAFDTESFNVTASEGSLARESLRHVLAFNALLKNKLTDTIKLNTGYRISQNEFLGESLFSDNDDNTLDSFDDDEGADFLQQSFTVALRKELSQITSVGLEGGFVIEDFSDSGDIVDRSSDLDRTEYRISATGVHDFSEQLKVSARVGLSKNNFKNSQEITTEPILGTSGLEEDFIDRGGDSTSLLYSLTAVKILDEQSQVSLNITQDTDVDIQGERIFRRDISLSYDTWVKEKLRVFTTGKILWFNNEGDNDLSDNSFTRYSFTLGSNYSLTESLTLSAGWNFSSQDEDETDTRITEDGFLFLSDEYVSNRFFISLNKGFVGILN